MAGDRVKVWVQKFPDRANLMLQWHDPETGRRKSQSAGTADPDAAEEARSDLESDLNHGRHKETSRMSWERFRELFEDEYVAGLKDATQRTHRNVLNLFEEICNPRSLRAINERTISLFLSGLRKRPGRSHEKMVPITLHTRLEFLHTALSWAVQQKFIPAVPTFPKVDVPEGDPSPVPAESFERLLAKAGTDLQMRAFLLCGWLAGLRRNEAIFLEWSESPDAPWVDLAHNRIRLPKSFVKAKRDQWVPLDPELRKALEGLPRREEDPRVFHFTMKNGRRLAPTSISDRVVQLAKKAGVKLDFKALRRGFGCRYAARVPAQVLQKLMRHSNIKITMKYYANVDDAVEAAVLGPRNTSRNTAEVGATV